MSESSLSSSSQKPFPSRLVARCERSSNSARRARIPRNYTETRDPTLQNTPATSKSSCFERRVDIRFECNGHGATERRGKSETRQPEEATCACPRRLARVSRSFGRQTTALETLCTRQVGARRGPGVKACSTSDRDASHHHELSCESTGRQGADNAPRRRTAVRRVRRAMCSVNLTISAKRLACLSLPLRRCSSRFCSACLARPRQGASSVLPRRPRSVLEQHSSPARLVRGLRRSARRRKKQVSRATTSNAY